MAHILAQTFFERHDNALTAIASVVLAIVAAGVLDRVMRRAARARIVSDRLDPSIDTRLRFVRRVSEATILVFGIAVALSQFTALDHLATSVLASGAIAAAVIGFGARQTIANAIAGLLLAITQPLRIGDTVTIEGETGVVEDVRLVYTYLRDARGTRIVIPNERLAAGLLRNETVLGGPVEAEAKIWLAPGADVERAIAAIEAAMPEVKVTVAESVAEGVALLVAGAATAPAQRLAREAELRRAALAAATKDS